MSLQERGDNQGMDMATKSKNCNTIVCAIDDNMVYALIVFAHSFARNAENPVEIVIGHIRGELSQKNQELVTSVLDYLGVEHRAIELLPDPRFISQDYISSTTYARFVLADLVTECHVWVDVDTVASPGWDSIFDKIRNSPPESLLVVASRGSSDTSSEGNSYRTRFNAGVLGWPARNRLAWAEQLDSLRPPRTDQDILNELYHDCIFEIAHDYNSLTRKLDIIQEDRKPFITHYAGANKPWHLPRRFAKLCIAHRCPWSIWFRSENELLEEVKSSSLNVPILQAQRRQQSLRIRAPRWNYPTLYFLRILQALGVGGWLLLLALWPLTKFVPRGTHPLHPRD